MDMLFDILVNVSPIILIFNIYTFYKSLEDEKGYWSILDWTLFILFGLSVFSAIIDHGTLLMSIITLILITGVYAFFLYLCFPEKLLFCVIWTANIIFFLFSIYYKIKYGSNANFNFINRLKNIDIFKIYLLIIQNEWFKGIIIAASGGVISGIVLNKISKKK